MIIKRHLPFRHSREGYVPDRIVLRFCNGSADQWERILKQQNRAAHYHLAKDGTVTAFSPLTAAASLLGPIGSDLFAVEESIPAARRGILILMERRTDSEATEQREPLVRLLKQIQKEILRIYGERFPFSADSLLCENGTLPLEELLEEGIFFGEDRRLFRVQTGVYRSRRDAEESVQRLQNAGIASYITEVNDR